MLKIIVPSMDLFNEEDNTFTTVPETIIELEHSLLAMSKWESKFQVPFLGSSPKTNQEMLEYVRLMIVTPNYPENILSRLTSENYDSIKEYIESSQSATTFSNRSKAKGKPEIITSELIYYWMVAFTIPFECESWNLNRLFALIRICDIKNSKPKPMTQRELAERNRSINEQRKAKLGTRG